MPSANEARVWNYPCYMTVWEPSVSAYVMFRRQNSSISMPGLDSDPGCQDKSRDGKVG